MKWASFAALVAFAVCAPESFAQEGRWQFVTIGAGGTVVSIDRSTMIDEEGVVTVWVQYLQSSGGEYVGSRQVVKSLQRQEFHCRPMKVGILSVVKFDKNGSGISNQSTDYPRFEPVIPDTVDEAVWKSVCM